MAQHLTSSFDPSCSLLLSVFKYTTHAVSSYLSPFGPAVSSEWSALPPAPWHTSTQPWRGESQFSGKDCPVSYKAFAALAIAQWVECRLTDRRVSGLIPRLGWMRAGGKPLSVSLSIPPAPLTSTL